MIGDREQMKKALRALVVPKLRAMGFSGSFPHFRRKHGSAHELLLIMFSRHGGSFYLEAARISESEFQERQRQWSAAGKSLPEEKLTVGHANGEATARLGGANVGPESDHWFEFRRDNCDDVALLVVKTLEEQVELFFSQVP